MIDSESIGTRVQYYRRLSGLSQEDLAERTKTNRVHISNIERGEKTPSLELIIDIANTLCISSDDLLAENLFNCKSIRNEKEMDILYDCTKEESSMLLECMRAIKRIIRKYRITK